MMLPLSLKWLSLVGHRRVSHENKKTIFGVKYIYLFWRATRFVAGWPVSVEELRSDVAVGELVTGRPVSVEGLPFDVGWGMFAVTMVNDDRDQIEYLKLKIAYFIRPGISSNGFSWVIGMTRRITAGIGNSAPRHWRCLLGLKLPRRLNR